MKPTALDSKPEEPLTNDSRDRAGRLDSATPSPVACPAFTYCVLSEQFNESSGAITCTTPKCTSIDQCNQQYTIYALTDSSGNVSERYAYAAYGQPTFLNATSTVQASSAAGNRYTYTGREWDQTIGLHHFRARWMSGLCGRFVSRDPIKYKGGLNVSSYVNNRPFSWNDPTGLLSVAPGTGFNDEHYTWIGWWANLSPIKEYVASNCSEKCRCSLLRGNEIANIIENASVEAQRIAGSIPFDPGLYPGVFEDPEDFLTPEQIAAGESPTYPANLQYGGRAHSALRHCLWSAMMARDLVNCECSACIADTRDMFQYLYGDPPGHYQGIANTQQAIYNDREGRNCAGCTGAYKAFTPRDVNNYIMPARSNEELTYCCSTKLTTKKLATNVNTPGVMPVMPVRPAINVPPQQTPPNFPWPGVF